MALLLGTLYKYTQNFIVYMGMFLAYLYFQPNIVHIMYWFLLSFWLIQLIFHLFSSVQFISVTQSCPTLWDPMNRSTPGLHLHDQLPESTQTHVHWVSDAIQPSHPLSTCFCSYLQSFPVSGFFPMNWLFTPGGQRIWVSASALSIQWIFRVDFL